MLIRIDVYNAPTYDLIATNYSYREKEDTLDVDYAIIAGKTMQFATPRRGKVMHVKREHSRIDEQRYSIRSVDDLRTLVDSADLDIIQIRKVPPSGEIASYFLNDASLTSARVSGAVRLRGTLQPGMLAFLLFLSQSGDTLCCRMEAHQGDLIYVPEGGELAAIFGPGERHLAIIVAPARDLRSFLGEHAAGLLPLPAVPVNYHLAPHQRDHLMEQVRDAFSALSRPSLHSPSEREKSALTQALFAALAGAIPARLAETASAPVMSDARLVAQVEDLCREREGEVLSVPDVCEALSVPRRTLERVFRRLLDMSPAQYILLVRLSAVRRELQTEEDTSVSAAATKYGFYELGRFSSRYRSLFGELPSQTLLARRREAEAPGAPRKRPRRRTGG